MPKMVFVAALFSMCLGLPGADTNPYLKLTSVIKDGKVRVSAENISHKPMVAYVVAFEDGGKSATSHGVYSGKDVFAPGTTVEIVLDVNSLSNSSKIFVDYLRFADGSSWGAPVTQDGKEVAARFQK